MKLQLLLFLIVFGSICFANGKSKAPAASSNDQSPNTYKEVAFIYPPGIRSERDIPVCPSWHQRKGDAEIKESSIGGLDIGMVSDDPFTNSKSSSPVIELTPEGVLTGNPAVHEEGILWESACNILHKRFFYPPVVERLCRCPDRTECPWEYSQPPSYQNAPTQTSTDLKGGSQATTSKGSKDPYTLMISSRSQAKFCREVTTALPRCKNIGGGKKEPGGLRVNMVKSVRKTTAGNELPRVSVNCYCPPLYRKWTYVGQTKPKEYGNGTLETNFFYKCDRLPRCERDQKCGNIRTDLHFSFYHCSCPKKHLCLPRTYPPESVTDVEEDVNEVLFRGQVAPAYCTPYS